MSGLFKLIPVSRNLRFILLPVLEEDSGIMLYPLYHILLLDNLRPSITDKLSSRPELPVLGSWLRRV
jgi:hypothetical protein